MCGLKTYIDNLTEDELKEIATLKEECAKENQTQEEYKLKKRLSDKNWNKTHKKEVSEKNRLPKSTVCRTHHRSSKETIKTITFSFVQRRRKAKAI